MVIYEFCSSEEVTIRGLLGRLVGNHLLLESNQNLLQGSVLAPAAEEVELAGLDGSVALVHARKVDFGSKANYRCGLWVVRATFNVEEENSVVEVGVRGTNNGAVPLGKGLVISLVEAVGNRLIRELGVFSFLKFFVEAESSGN